MPQSCTTDPYQAAVSRRYVDTCYGYGVSFDWAFSRRTAFVRSQQACSQSTRCEASTSQSGPTSFAPGATLATSPSEAIQLYHRTYPGGSKNSFVFDYQAYYLDLEAPAVGIPRATRVANRNGEDRVDTILTSLQRVDREHDIQFSFDSKVGSTRDSHRLLQYVRERNGGPAAQKALLEEIYQDHFERDEDIIPRTALVKAAAVGVLEQDVPIS
ncbi:unnamed protein product [Zymoseptoria tritici ST99CH_1A5]|uniref:Uncharacterized protein n=1 Tax=Zymoseptoria tritici ST99CH_1A5 TaxID=1276529 RepID=A0A1Y6LAQ4_ZYMTR|nr:unnamed protein product [Zymoseptoria tritici ST99CH_3D1]SMY21534.1 unnamed protein product [Zymoseptoria tritici ST99CH_1A5]